jgi:hypothetical protein
MGSTAEDINSFFHALIFLAQMERHPFPFSLKERLQLIAEIKNKIKDPFTENRCVSGVFK